MGIELKLRKEGIDIYSEYPEVPSTLIDKEKNIWECSTDIIKDVLSKNFKKTDIDWSYGSTNFNSYFEIKMRTYHKPITIQKALKILHNSDDEIKYRIQELINNRSN